MKFPEREKGIQKLIWMRNHDGGWGEFKTQPSGITNTCEVVWCLATIKPDEEIDTAINFIKRAIKKQNNSQSEQCEIARDYGWSVIALSAANALEKELLDICLNEFEKESANIPNKGYAGRENKYKFSVFNTAIVLYGLVCIIKNSFDPEQKDRSLKLAENAVNAIIQNQNTEDGGWGNGIQDAKSETAYTCYAIFALSVYHSLNLPNSDHIVDTLKKSIVYVRNENLYFTSQESDSRPDNRPYRHFSHPWLLMGLTQSLHENLYIDLKIRIVHELIQFLGASDGHWNVDSNKREPTSWATALALISLNNFYESIEFYDFIKILNDQSLKIKELQDNNFSKKIYQFFLKFRTKYPTYFNIIKLVIIPLLLFPIFVKLTSIDLLSNFLNDWKTLVYISLYAIYFSWVIYDWRK